MTYTRFVLKNVLRNKRRSALAVLSIACSLFLVMTLQVALDQVLNPPETDWSVLRMTVRGKSMTEQLPISYRDRIARIPGVRRVMLFHYFGGIYQEPKNFFVNFGIDPDLNWEMFPEHAITPAHRKAFVATKDGAAVGEDIMSKFGWKVGDRVTLKGSIFPVDLDFQIVATFKSSAFNAFFFHYDYFNEAMHGINKVGNFWVQAENPGVMASVMERIDAEFRNSSAETRTETEKAFRLNFLSTLGNIKALAGSLMTVIAFTMILVAGSTMAMTIRERTREIGILKSLGFPSRTVLGLILSEALIISLLGFGVACVGSLGLRFLDVRQATQGFVDRLSATPKMFVVSFSVALGIGMIGALYPAMRASAMTITSALRRTN